MKDPRSMKLDSLIKFFKHISERESSHGITNAFRFKSVLSSRKKGSIRPARYQVDGDISDEAENSEVVPITRRRKRRKGQQEPQVPRLLDNDINVERIESLTVPDNMPKDKDSSAEESDDLPITGRRSRNRLITPTISDRSTRSNPNIPIPTTETGLCTPEDTPAPAERNLLSPANMKSQRRGKRADVITQSHKATTSAPRRSGRKQGKLSAPPTSKRRNSKSKSRK